MSNDPNASSASRPMDRSQALAAASQAIADLKSKHDFVILEDKTLERPFGWVFFYTTRQHRDTGNIAHAVPGTAPLIVPADGGKPEFLSSSVPPQAAIAAWAKKRQQLNPAR